MTGPRSAEAGWHDAQCERFAVVHPGRWVPCQCRHRTEATDDPKESAMKPREYIDGYLTTTETVTDYLLVYTDGRTQALDYEPLMGPGDVLLSRERVVRTTFGGWSVAREGASVESLNPRAPLDWCDRQDRITPLMEQRAEAAS